MENTKQKSSGRWKLFAVLAVCAAPLIMSYVIYYGGFAESFGRTNYGAILDPRQHETPDLKASTLDGKPSGIDAFKGKWLMVRTGPGECDAACKKQMFAMRQLRLMQGKEMDRIERVWLVTDAAPLDTMVLREYDGVRILRVDPQALEKWLPVEQGSQMRDHLYMIDPLGNLMMRFPKDPEPAKVKKDIGKLLKASAIG
ncbi:MAG TPA: cytochrome C oxidase subunit I [Telluria sp.]|nr:cytochrome C oxidase subunit I [Telluria sp.]